MVNTKSEDSWKFFVDGKLYESTNQVITGEDIRAIAGVDKHMRLFLGQQEPNKGGRNGLDRQVLRHDRVDLSAPGEEKFYTLAPPQMDIY